MIPSIEEAQDYILDCYNVRKALMELDPSIWEPVTIQPNGDILSLVDGRKMTETEFLTKHPSGTFKCL